jgi:glycosyltransferase involved in cell wall biosynthesis
MPAPPRAIHRLGLVRVLLDVSAVPPRPVGAGVYTVALVRGLDQHPEVELHLAARRDDVNRWNTLAPRATLHATVPNRRPARLIWEQTRGAALAANVSADVWHGPHYTMPRALGSTASVVTIHDLTFFDHPEWHERVKVAYFRHMIQYAARYASVLVCDSEHTAARLRVHCEPRGEVRVVRLGVDHERFSPASDDTALGLLAPHGIEPPFVAFAGTLEPRKNLPALIEAFARIAKTRPDVRLVLAGGDGWGVDAVRDAITTSGTATRIVRPGYLDDQTLVALLGHAAAVAYPSFEEGFGLPALEALACGTPLVASDSSAIREVVGDAGLLVAPNDVDAIAGALARILDDPQLAARLRNAGPARAAAYTWARCVDGYVAAYEHALHQRVPA